MTAEMDMDDHYARKNGIWDFQGTCVTITAKKRPFSLKKQLLWTLMTVRFGKGWFSVANGHKCPPQKPAACKKSKEMHKAREVSISPTVVRQLIDPMSSSPVTIHRVCLSSLIKVPSTRFPCHFEGLFTTYPQIFQTNKDKSALFSVDNVHNFVNN